MSTYLLDHGYPLPYVQPNSRRKIISQKPATIDSMVSKWNTFPQPGSPILYIHLYFLAKHPHFRLVSPPQFAPRQSREQLVYKRPAMTPRPASIAAALIS